MKCISRILDSRKFHSSSGKMKGLELPVNMIVIIGAALLVVVVIGAFFLTNTGQRTSEAEAIQALNKQCADNNICSVSSTDNYLTATTLESKYPALFNACLLLVPEARTYPNRCIEKCGCNLAVTQEENEQFFNQIKSS